MKLKLMGKSKKRTVLSESIIGGKPLKLTIDPMYVYKDMKTGEKYYMPKKLKKVV